MSERFSTSPVLLSRRDFLKQVVAEVVLLPFAVLRRGGRHVPRSLARKMRCASPPYLSSDAVVRTAPHVYTLPLGTRRVLLDLHGGRMYGLNPTAAVLWDELRQGSTWAALVLALQRRYGRSRVEAEAETRAFLLTLWRAGLLVAA